MSKKLAQLLSEKFGGSQVRLLSMAIDADAFADDAAPQWHQIAPEGKFEGHPMGPFELRESHFEQIINNAKRQATDIVVDYEHNTLNPFVEKAPAAGWINSVDLDVRDTPQGKGLFAKIDWTETARQHIKRREFKYQSPVIVWNTQDRKTGQDLGASVPSVALTNVPFFDEIPALHLNSMIAHLNGGLPPKHLQEQNAMNKEQMAALAKILGLATDATPEEITAASMAQSKDLHALSQVAKACGIDEGASAGAIVAAVTGLQQSKAELEAKTSELTALADEGKKAKAATMIDTAKKAGKIVASNEQWATKLASDDPEAFEAWAACAPSIVPTSPKDQPPADDPQVTALSDLDKKHAAAIGMSHEDYAKFSQRHEHQFSTRRGPTKTDPGFKLHGGE